MILHSSRIHVLFLYLLCYPWQKALHPGKDPRILGVGAAEAIACDTKKNAAVALLQSEGSTAVSLTGVPTRVVGTQPARRNATLN